MVETPRGQTWNDRSMPSSRLTSDLAEQQLAALGEIHTRFTSNGIEYWLFGGWAVDFHAGRVTREHTDLDLAVWKADLDKITEMLEAASWLREPDDADGVVIYRRAAVCAEFALLERDEAGVIYTPVESGRGEWPQSGFGDRILELAGARARVFELMALIEEKSAGYGDVRVQAKDHADVAILLDSVALPERRLRPTSER